MNHVVREDSKSWDNSKLATCFFDCMSNLWIGLQKEIIKDTFYPDVSNITASIMIIYIFLKILDFYRRQVQSKSNFSVINKLKSRFANSFLHFIIQVL